MADLNQAKKKLDRIVWNMWQQDPVMFGALSMLDKVPSQSQETMGLDTSGRSPTLRYNPNFVNSVSQERLELVMVIEGFRTLLRHATTRLKDPPQISALSSSLSINQLMNDDLMKLIQGIDEVTPDPKMFGLPDKQAFEEYYRGLMDKVDKTNQTISKIWGSMSKEQKQKMINDAFDKYQQKMEEQEQKKDGDGFKDFKDEKEAMKDYMDPNGTGNQQWSSNDMIDASVKQFINKIRNRTKQWGKYTGDAQATILANLDPKISARDMLRRFSASVMCGKTVPSRMKINRRRDLEIPGYRRTYKPKVILAIDVSGSISDEDLQYAFSIVNRILFYAEIIFIQFDTEIKSQETNLRRARKEFKVMGRGGTDFECVMNLADELNVDGTIVYTDGYASEPHKPRGKVLWLMANQDQNPPCTWGLRAHLDRFADDRAF